MLNFINISHWGEKGCSPTLVCNVQQKASQSQLVVEWQKVVTLHCQCGAEWALRRFQKVGGAACRCGV